MLSRKSFCPRKKQPATAEAEREKTFWHWLVVYFSNASGEKIYIVPFGERWQNSKYKKKGKDLRVFCAKSSTNYIKCVLNCFTWEHQQLAWKAVSDVMLFKKYWIMFAFQLSPNWLWGSKLSSVCFFPPLIELVLLVVSKNRNTLYCFSKASGSSDARTY